MNDNLHQQLKKALQFAQQDRLQEAQVLFLEVLTHDASQADALHGMGLLLVQQRDFKSALPWLCKAVEAAPHVPGFHNNLANCYKALGQVNLAKRHYHEALRLKSPYPEARNNLGHLLFRQGLTFEACEHLQKAVREDPEHVDAHYNLANCYTTMDRLNDAIGHYRAILKLRPDHLGAAHNLGIALTALKNFHEARPYLLQVIERSPNEVDALFHLGIIEASLGNLDSAASLYQRAIMLNPNHSDAYHNLATVYLHQKQTEQAMDCYHKALALNPHNQTAQHMLDALTGKSSPTGAPPEYVRALFDQYAYNYDEHVGKGLKYQTPAALRELISPLALKAVNLWSVLDLGCGTGLCAPYFRDVAKTLVGVDLSPNMIEVAQQRGGYDKLIVQDIATYLQRSNDSFHLMIAADVFVYFSDLSIIFKSVWDHLEPGGIFCFSVELLQNEQSNFYLQSTGRYAHNQIYVTNLANETGFKVYAQKHCALRKHEDAEILGELFVLIKATESVSD